MPSLHKVRSVQGIPYID